MRNEGGKRKGGEGELERRGTGEVAKHIQTTREL
jgi:hypothetical protein